MNRIIPIILGLLVGYTHCFAQDNNPLINSGEIIKQGSKLHDEGKFKDAILAYDKIPSSDTNYIYSLYEKALSCYSDSQYQKGLSYCEEAMAMPDRKELIPKLYAQYGGFLDVLGQQERALRVFDSAIAIYPASTVLYLNKGTTLIRMDEYAKAEKVFQQAILMDPYSSGCHYKLAVSAMSQGKSIPAFLGYLSYLLLSPEGKFAKSSINMMNSISKSQDGIIELINARKDKDPENFQMVEQIVLSKIALDKNYKALIKLDDPISRQLQVILEKIEYSPDEKDFYMQYYVPMYKKFFKEDKFEILVNYAFSSANIPSITAYVKKNKKELTALADEASTYFNLLRSTREINFNARKPDGDNYYYENGKLVGKGNTSADGKAMTGLWMFYYPEGNKKAIGAFNTSGLKTGVWKYYYFDGTLRGQELYENGKEEGEEIYYYPNGNNSSRGTYANGLVQGTYTRYNKWGAVTSLEQYTNSKINGTRKTFFASGALQSIENYTNEKLDGPFKIYHENGNLEREGSYTNGKINGTFKWYHKNGILQGEGLYENDEQTGIWKRYYSSGKLKQTENYVNNKLEGEYTEYHKNGQLLTKYMNRKGKTNGDASYYDEDGKMYIILTFENDKLKSSKYFDKTGKQISISEIRDKRMEQVAYTAEGYKWKSGGYNEKGIIDGTWNFYFNSGTLATTVNYKDGYEEGTYTGYHANKKKSYELSYTAGKKDGYYTSYYVHGTKEKEGWYKNDLAEGTWISYDEQGNVTEKLNYLNGEFNGSKTSYHPNGKINSEAWYNMGILDHVKQFDTTGKVIYISRIKNGNGPYKLVHFNGKTAVEASFVNGNLNGIFTFYYFDGSPRTREFFRNGILDSSYRDYYYGGIVQTEGQYKMNDKTGLWKHYNEEGKLLFTENYRDGELNGNRTYYYPNGKIEFELPFVDDTRQGVVKKFNELGNLMYQLTYDGGAHKGYSYYGKDNKLVPEIPIPGDNGPVTAYYPNGNKSVVFAYTDGKLNGTNNEYYENGQIKQESTEVFNSSEGLTKSYYADGKLQSAVNYLHDNTDGPYRKMSEKGILKEEGTYYNGSLNGTIKYYDDNGKLKETRYYYYGQLLNVKK